MKTTPMGHQQECLDKMFRKRNFAILMEQGLGKTWTLLADAERCFLEGKIDALLILAPNGVHSNWIRREIPAHMEVKTKSYIWRGRPTSKKAQKKVEDFFQNVEPVGKKPLFVFAINIEALRTAAGVALCERFIKEHKVMIAVDESTRIKNHKGVQHKAAKKLGKLCVCRRILSGTPLTKAPTDLFGQFDFLKPGLLGTKSYAAFNAQYSVLLEPTDPLMIAVMKKLEGKSVLPPQIVKKDDAGRPMYRNLDKLAEMIKPHSFRATKEDYLDLPPKIYQTVSFELTKKQREVYERLRDEYSFLFDVHGQLKGEYSPIAGGMSIEMDFAAIAARSKMKQVTSGFINIQQEPVFLAKEDNPRLKAFDDYIDQLLEVESDRQIIVWAIFKEELKAIMQTLKDKGLSCALYDGSTPKEERERIIDDFQAGNIQFFVGHAQAAGIGITLTAASLAIYYSCSFDWELRAQSEDRCHRIGTKRSVVYVDIVAEDTIDEDIQISLTSKEATAGIVLDSKG